MLCGAVFLLAGFLRLGFVAQFLSRPVMEGFVFGLAIFVTVKQLPKLFGIDGSDGDTIRQFLHVLETLGETSGLTLAVGVAALAILFGGERYFPRIPGGLIVLALGIAGQRRLRSSAHGVEVVGKVPSGLPSASLPDVSRADLAAMLATAAGMALVIFSESLGAAENFARKHGYEIDSNQELIALGTCNLGSGLIGGLASGGSLSQSAVNDGAGARSEMSPVVATVLSLVTVLALTPLFTDLPEAVLAALIIHAVSHLWKIPQFRRYYGERRPEFWMGAATLAGVVVIDVLPGLVIGIASMLILVIYHASRPHLSVLGEVPGTPGAYGDVARHPDYPPRPGLLILRLESPLFYVNAALVSDHIKALVGGSDPVPRTVILDIGANGDLDVTSAETLTQLATTLHQVPVDLALAEVRLPVLEMARRSGLLTALGEDHIFHTVREAVESSSHH